MKISKLILGVFLLTSCLGQASCSNLSSKTNYHVSMVENSYKTISKEDFLENYKKNRKAEYDYVAIESTHKNAISLFGGAIQYDGGYYVGKINKTHNEDSSNWIVCGHDINSNPQYNASLFKWYSFSNAYHFDLGEQFTSNPYSYVVNSKGIGESTKFVFDNNFNLSSLKTTYEGNEVEMKFKYFNENDLPVKSGKVSRETYFDVAFVKSYSTKDTYSKGKATFECEHSLITIKTEIVDDASIRVPVYGDMTYELNYDIENYGTGINKINDRWDYEYSIENYTLISGEKPSNENTFVLQLTGYIDQGPLTSEFLFPYNDTLKEKKLTYSINPLRVTSVIAEGINTKVEYNDDCFITKYESSNGDASIKVKCEYTK